MKPAQQKNLVFILVPSTILIVLWIVFSVYDKAVMSTISKSQTVAIQPISPAFPTGVLTTLQNRKSPTPLYSIDSVPNVVASDEGALTPTAPVTPSPVISQPADASPSGSIGGGR